MKYLLISLVSVVSFSLQAGVDLTLQEPKKFIDIRDHNLSVTRSAELFQSAMQEYLEQHELLQGRNLKLTFHDVDLAGEIRYQVTAQNQNMRVLRDVARVRLEFDYELTDPMGKTLGKGQENLSDLFTLSRVDYRRSDRESYYFEKKLLDNWLKNLLK